jgi:hypothetical protein
VLALSCEKERSVGRDRTGKERIDLLITWLYGESGWQEVWQQRPCGDPRKSERLKTGAKCTPQALGNILSGLSLSCRTSGSCARAELDGEW